MYDVVDKFSLSSSSYDKLPGKLSLQIIKDTYFVNNAIVEIKLTSISSMWVASFPLQSIENECVSSVVRMYIGILSIDSWKGQDMKQTILFFILVIVTSFTYILPFGLSESIFKHR